MNNKDTQLQDTSDEISVKDIILKVQAVVRYLKNKWLIILLTGLLFGAAGLAYSIFKKPLYVATCTFVLDETNSHGALAQYAGLASLAGIELNGGGSNGLFQGDNILELYKSRLMIERALLCDASFGSTHELLIDRYINFNKLRERWKKKNNIDSISFTGDPEKFNRKQDSIITDLVELFNKKVLNVSRPDKKLSIIQVDVSSQDELFAKYFNEYLVQNVNNFYIQTLTKKTAQNVQILQKQADSVKNELNVAISGVASAADASPNANPLMQSLRVPSQRKQIDVQANSAIYSGIMQNLEIAKVTLRQETPLIQIIDQPVLPLAVNRIGKMKGFLIGIFIGAFLCVFVLVIKKGYSVLV